MPSGPPGGTRSNGRPDALYYQARVLELRGEDGAVDEVFHGPLAADLRVRDPATRGNDAWVEYNEPFYERRVAVPLAAAAIYPAAEERSLLYLSLAGYVAAVLALFGLLLPALPTRRRHGCRPPRRLCSRR